MDPLVVALTFGAIFVVELPDKTFIATLVLSTRFRPMLVWLGVGLAFLLQTGIAVGLGQAAGLLPTTWVHAGAAALFLVGAVLLAREALSHDDTDSGEEYAERAGNVVSTSSTSAVKVVAASFVVLFAAEWGDLSQLLTLSLVARYDDAVSVFVGAWTALLTVSGLAVLGGRVLLRLIPLHALHAVGAVVCLVLAGLTVFELTT